MGNEMIEWVNFWFVPSVCQIPLCISSVLVHLFSYMTRISLHLSPSHWWVGSNVCCRTKWMNEPLKRIIITLIITLYWTSVPNMNTFPACVHIRTFLEHTIVTSASVIYVCVYNIVVCIVACCMLYNYLFFSCYFRCFTSIYYCYYYYFSKSISILIKITNGVVVYWLVEPPQTTKRFILFILNLSFPYYI